MKKSTLKNLRNVVAAAAICLTGMTMFTGCEKDIDPIDTGTEQDADIVAFTFTGIDGTATIDKTAHTVTAKAKETVNLTALVTEFTLSTGATAKVGNTVQVSKQTANNFTSPVTYRVTSGDGVTTTDWAVSITKTGGTTPVTFQKKTFSNHLDYYNFMPQGVFLFRDIGSWDNLIAKCTDGSITLATISNYNSDRWKVGDINDYHIWHGTNHYKIFFEIDDQNQTRYFRHEGNFTSENTLGVSEKVGMIATSSNYYTGITASPNYTNIFPPPMSGWDFTCFIKSNDCETATFEKNDVVAGIACKKYVKGVLSWWVLDNGFCLKHTYNDIVRLDLVKGSFNAPNYDAVLQEYYKDPDITTPSVVPLASMPSVVILKDKAFVQGGYLPWTAGNFKYSYSAGNLKDGMIKWEIELDSGVTAAQLNEYVSRINQIPNMTQTSGASTAMSFSWEGDNSCISSGYCPNEHPHLIGDKAPYVGYRISYYFEYNMNRFITFTVGTVLHV